MKKSSNTHQMHKDTAEAFSDAELSSAGSKEQRPGERPMGRGGSIAVPACVRATQGKAGSLPITS